MAISADRVVVELEARLDKYDARLAAAERKFDKTMSNMRGSAGRTEGFISRSAGRMGSALAAVSAVALARGMLAITDEAKKLDAQLRLATQSFGNYAQAQEDVRRIAETTRNDIKAVSSLYSAFARSANELGLEQAEVARITETVGKAFKISGASTVDSAQAIRQLTQAFQSGVLRGDEFNSIMENAPRLAQLLAESLGTTKGALRAMAEEGELSADKLARAFTDTKFTEGLDAEFKQIPVTFDDAMTLVYNSAVTTFGAFDRGGQFSAAIATFVSDTADGFGDMEAAAERFGATVSAEIAGVTAVVGGLIDQLTALATGFDSATGGALSWLNEQAAKLNPVAVSINGIRNSSTYRNAQAQRAADLAVTSAERQWQDTTRGMSVADILRGGRDTGPRGVPAPSKGKGRTARALRSPLNPEAFAREEQALLDEQLQLQRDALQTAEERAAAEIARLQAERAFEAEKVATDERFTAAQKERLIALQATTYALQGAAVIAERDKEIAERTADQQDAAIRARRENARLEADALQERLRLARTRVERADIEGRLLSLAEEQERVELETLISLGRVADAAAARADLAEMQGSRREGARLDNQGPLERYRDGLNLSREELQEQAELLIVDELEYVREGMRNALTDALGVNDPLIGGLIDLFIEQVIMEPIANAFANAATAKGGFFGALIQGVGSVIAGGRAGGGHVVAGRTYAVSDDEGFQPAGSGKIIPLGRMRHAGGAGVVINQTVKVDARGSVNPEGYAEHIVERVRGETVAIVGESMRRTNRAAPLRLAQFQRDGT